MIRGIMTAFGTALALAACSAVQPDTLASALVCYRDATGAVQAAKKGEQPAAAATVALTDPACVATLQAAVAATQGLVAPGVKAAE